MRRSSFFILVIAALVFSSSLIYSLTARPLVLAAGDERNTASAEPAAVPGTELHDNVAYIKDGYKFVDRGDAVDVVRVGRVGLNVKTGTYTCPCHRKDGTGKCEMVFTTRRISCRTGSCIGVSCLLTASIPVGTRR